MAVHIISTAAQLNTATHLGGAGLDIWSSAPDVSVKFGSVLDAPSEIHGVVGMLLQGLRRLRTVAMPGDVIQIAIPGGEASLECLQDANADALGLRAHMNAYEVIEHLEAEGIEIRWLTPVRNHSGIAHALVEAQGVIARMEARTNPAQSAAPKGIADLAVLAAA